MLTVPTGRFGEANVEYLTEAKEVLPGAVVAQSLTVTDGIFNTSLDFGAAFPGANRTLEIAVKINAGNIYTILNRRQPVLSAPYSIKSKTAENSIQLGGVDSSLFVRQDAGGNVSIAGNFTVNGALSLQTVNSKNQYNLGGQRILTADYGNQSLSLGQDAGNTSASFNTFVGALAGTSNTTGQANAFFGYGSGSSNAIGSNNSFFGTSSGLFNTAGDNSFFGSEAGRQNTTGDRNAFFGISAGTSNVDGCCNSFFGSRAGQFTTSGANNVFVGLEAGAGNVSGGSNTALGSRADVGANLTNATAIGANTSAVQSNTVILGNSASVGIGTNTPKAKLDVMGGNILVVSPGQGIVLKLPDAATCKLLSIDNAGAFALTTVSCP